VTYFYCLQCPQGRASVKNKNSKTKILTSVKVRIKGTGRVLRFVNRTPRTDSDTKTQTQKKREILVLRYQN
jgi:hypothetical protein